MNKAFNDYPPMITLTEAIAYFLAGAFTIETLIVSALNTGDSPDKFTIGVGIVLIAYAFILTFTAMRMTKPKFIASLGQCINRLSQYLSPILFAVIASEVVSKGVYFSKIPELHSLFIITIIFGVLTILYIMLTSAWVFSKIRTLLLITLSFCGMAIILVLRENAAVTNLIMLGIILLTILRTTFLYRIEGGFQLPLFKLGMLTGRKEMKISFFNNIRKGFNNEYKCGRDEIEQTQHEEWERAIHSIRQTQLEKNKWKLNKDTEALIQIKNPPFILYIFRCFFSFLFLFSISKWLSQTQRKQEEIENGDLSPYRCVDWYVIGWFLFEFVVLLWLIIAHGVFNFHIYSWELVTFCVLTGFFCYRLFDISQSWVNQFILRGNWNALNVNRSLVLAFTGYFEIIMIGTIIRFRFQQPVRIGQSLYDSVTAMIASPGDKASPIQYTQIFFAVLFAAVVVQHVVNRLSSK